MFKKVNKKIFLAFGTLVVLSFVLIPLPSQKAMAFSNRAPTYVDGHYNEDGSYTFGDFVWPAESNTSSATNGASNAPFINTNQNQRDSDNIKNKNTKGEKEETVSALAGNAIFGATSIVPSGLIQWVLFGILVLLIVIVVRKFYGAEAYHATPLKHK